mmetsp:Transcript_1646/g.3854  ORF Transcript_1646/g.3854 Transcript_1646/m.3854 type:complete len:119 (-) Transcript_1646:1632-1988(-)
MQAMESTPRHDATTMATFDQFSRTYNKYPASIAATYHIVRDMALKQEVVDIQLKDGASSGANSYLIECRVVLTGVRRVMIPLSADADVDLLWLKYFLQQRAPLGWETLLCIHSPETVM